MSEEPRQNNGRGLVDRKLVEAPSNFIAGRPKASLLFCLLLVVLLARCIPFVSIVYICLIGILALRPPVLQFQLPALLLVCVFFVLFLLFVVVLSDEPRQKQGRGLVDHKLVQAPPSNFYCWPSQGGTSILVLW